LKILFICNTGHVVKWVDELRPKYETMALCWSPQEHSNIVKRAVEFDPDVVHFYWREHRDPKFTINAVKELKKILRVPLILQTDWQPRWLVDDDLEFANSGDLLITDTILGRDFYPGQVGLRIPTYYIGGEEYSIDYRFIGRGDNVWLTFENLYDTLAGKSVLFDSRGTRKFNRQTKEWQEYTLNVVKAENRKPIWGTMWHTRPELVMTDKFKLMNILKDKYKCRWFCGWTANDAYSMRMWANGAGVNENYYEPLEHMFIEYWEKLSECTCTLDNQYWGMSSLGTEAAALKIPHVGTPTVTSAVILNPKLVCEEDNLDQQAEKVRWLIDNPEEARKLGEEAHNNFLEHFSLENKLKRFEGMLKRIGLN